MRRYTKLARRLFGMVGATVIVLTLAKPTAGLLTDLAGHWSGSLVGALEARGIVSGDEQGQFRPDSPVTRAQLAKLLVAGLGHEEDARLLSGYPSRFTDVQSWHWAKGYIESLAETGGVEGYPDGAFLPEEQVSRAQMAVILVRLAGMTEQARRMRFETTAYTDDQSIPEWARGYVQVAWAAGVMSGFEDGSFKPMVPVTRAEASVALFRMLATKGRAFSLTGSLVKFDPATLKGTVRDQLGQDRAFAMAQGARYYRSGLPSAASQIRLLDQVWIVVGADGTGTYLDARYSDMLVHNVKVRGQSISFDVPGGAPEVRTLQPGALLFLNGKATALEQLRSAQTAYVALDRSTGEIRVLDAMAPSIVGKLVGVAVQQATLYVQVNQEMKTLTLAANAVIIRNGQRAQTSELQIDDQVQLVVGEAGAVTYVLAER